jgi:hypothetical protein
LLYEALVIEAFETLFNRRDYAAAQQFWSPHYIQRSAACHRRTRPRHAALHYVGGAHGYIDYPPMQAGVIADGSAS